MDQNKLNRMIRGKNFETDSDGRRVAHLFKSKRHCFSIYSDKDTSSRRCKQLIDFKGTTEMIKPLACVQWGEGDPTKALVYPPFVTFKEYLSQPESVSSEHLASVLKGFVQNVLSLQKISININISSTTLIVMGAQGKLLQTDLKTFNPQANYEASCEKNLADLSTVIKTDMKSENHILRKNKDFKVLMKCMVRCSTLARCRRLLAAPFLLSPLEMVFTLLPELHLLIGNCVSLKDQVIKHIKVRNWVQIVKEGDDYEIQAIMLGNQEETEFTCPCAFIKFLRNTVCHVVETRNAFLNLETAKAKAEKTNQKLTIESLKQLANYKSVKKLYKDWKLVNGGPQLEKLIEMVNDGHGSHPLLIHESPQRILDVIEAASPHMLSLLFYQTFKCIGNMGLLDCFGL